MAGLLTSLGLALIEYLDSNLLSGQPKLRFFRACSDFLTLFLRDDAMLLLM